MPPMSRQDKMIAEASSAASAASSRHSSMSSERRPSFIPQLSTSRNSSTDTTSVYTPTTITPVRERSYQSSWLPNTNTISRQATEDDSLIDVVGDIDVSPKVISPPPIHLSDLSKDFTNGRRSHDEGYVMHYSNTIPIVSLEKIWRKSRETEPFISVRIYQNKFIIHTIYHFFQKETENPGEGGDGRVEDARHQTKQSQ